MEIKDLKVGDTVYCRLTGNASRGKKEEELIQEWEIRRIGRKYVTAGKKGFPNSCDIQFEINDDYKQKTDYCVDYVLYVDKQEIFNEFELNSLCNWFRKEFNSYGKLNYSLEKLRKAKEILLS